MFCARLFICALWSPAGKGLTSWLSFVVSSVSLSLSHWYPGSGVVLDCIDSWSLHHYLLLVFLLLAEYHLKHTLKEPTIRNSYLFPNVPSHKWQNWKVDNGSSILSGLVVKLNNSKWLKYCVMILLVARRRVIIMITIEADNDKRLTWVLNWWEIVWTISFIVFSCENVNLSFLFVALYLALYAQY